MTMQASRRAFLQRASALSMAGAAAPWALNLAAMGSAAAAGRVAGYKAIVCVFLYGGNDHNNSVVPFDTDSYGQYQTLRGTLGHPAESLSALSPSGKLLDVLGNERAYALAPPLHAHLADVFNGNATKKIDPRMSVLLNIGTMMDPLHTDLPPKLFSHNDQQSLWQSGGAEGTQTGWGGRLGDLLMSGNGKETFTCVNVSGTAVFMSGASAVQYQVGAAGPMPLRGVQEPLFGSRNCSTLLRDLTTEATRYDHFFHRGHAAVMDRALTAYKDLGTLRAPVDFDLPGNKLAAQLQMVARMIEAQSRLGITRQVFMVSLGGFDTHNDLKDKHPELLEQVGSALRAFHDHTVATGVADQVTTFTASDFGRTMTVNNDGSDHGWGSMHLVLGGAVKGQNYVGLPPVAADDFGQGRLKPTTSVDQLAYTMGRWFGVSDADLRETILPNIDRWDLNKRTLPLFRA